MMLTDSEIHDWLEGDERRRSMFSDEEIEQLLMALAIGVPEFSLEDAHYFLNWCVKQVSGAALVGLVQKGLIVPHELRPDDSDVAFTAHPEISWPLD